MAQSARIGQNNKFTRRWANRGTRPSAPRDQKTSPAYFSGAIYPAGGKAAGLVLPSCNREVSTTEAMELHLEEIPLAAAPGAQFMCERWLDNPYYQLFCGEEFFCHKLPFERSSLTRWRQRMGEEKANALLQESLSVAPRTGAARPSDFTKAIVDTTVQEKAVAFPTDARPMHRARASCGLRKSMASPCANPTGEKESSR